MPAISPPPLIGTTTRSAFGAVGRDLQADRALSGDHRPVIERRDQHVPMPRHEFLSPKLRLTGSAILVLNWGFACVAGLVFWLLQGERDGGADEVECLPLFAGRLNQCVPRGEDWAQNRLAAR